MTRHARFADYTTSGAFALNLSRNQIAELSHLAGSGAGYVVSGGLERKGMIEPVAAPTETDPDKVEWRVSAPGFLTLQLLAWAGLTNGPPDPHLAEIADLRRQLEAARAEVAHAHLMARSALARHDSMAEALDLARYKAGEQDKLRVVIKLRDPRPDLSDADLRAWAASGADIAAEVAP